MTFVQLRAFQAVVEAGGFGAAARRLGVRQPTVSAQLAALERGYGVRLVDRGTGRLTDAGHSLSLLTGPLMELYAQADQVLRQAQAPAGSQLRIVPDAPAHILPALASVRLKNPEASFRIATANSAEALRQLRSGQADVAVAAEVPKDPTLHRAELIRQELVAVVRTDHPFARHKTIRTQELAREPLVAREQGSETWRAVVRAADQIGVSLHATITAEGREAVIAAVAAGLGVGVIAENELLDDPRVVMVDLCEPRMTMVEYVVCARRNAAGGVVAALLQAVTSSSSAK